MTKSRISSFISRKYSKVDYAKLLRYFGTSIGSVTYTEILLVILHSNFHVSNLTANMVATASATLWVFPVSKRWIWKNKDQVSLKSQVLPFWIMAALGFAFSSVVVYETQKLSSSSITLVLSNLSAYGLLWILKFVILERIFLKPSPESVK
jgi:putative flippase GtrA